MIRRQLGNEQGIVDLLREGFAELAAAQGQATRAARLWGAAEALREPADVERAPNLRADDDPHVAEVCSALGEEAFAAAWAEGRAMTLEQAVAYALEESSEQA